MGSHAGYDGDPGLAVAIVGMAARVPGARDVDAFWRLLREGAEGIRLFTDEELLARGVPPERLREPGFVRAGAVLEDVDAFDAAFFGYSPREAALMDPQHRAFLECAWEALERAGHGLDTDSRSVGVFSGTSLSTYLLFNLRTYPELLASEEAFQVMIGNDKDFIATRLAYHLDLKGPSMDVQTGCSTSLVATHLACQALLSFQCDVALAGGVSIDVPQRTGYVHQPGGIASPDGHCRPFDAAGQGTLFGNGVGVVVLKRLEDALADGSPIHAVIRATAVNNDGAAKLGFTAPSVEGQAEVIARAQALAGVPADSIGYVEAHGTGTLLGDPVEVSALTQVFRASTEATGFCALGSVKSNIGHLDAAAGVAGLIKATLAVEHGLIPPTLHFRTPNPNIDWAHGPFYVNAQAKEWRPEGLPRRAGVSSFGIGGTNAHAILDEPPPPEPSGPSRDWQLVTLSARTESALDEATRRLAAHLEAHPEQPLADVAYTLQLGRKAFAHRRMVVCADRADASAVLAELDRERVHTGVAKQGTRPVVFLFPGGGAQHLRMGQELYEKEPAFREAFDACAGLLTRRGGPALRDVLYPAPGGGDEGAPLPRPSVGLPALFAVEYALAKQWAAWGVEPEAMVGHSMGEYVAACLAGVFSLEDALALVSERGRLFEQLEPGGMLSVALPEEQVRPLLGARLSLAAANGPSQCVLAGDVAAVDALAAELAGRGVEHRRIHIDVAAHSHLIDPILPAFSAFVRRLKLSAPTRPFVSCVSGTWITPEEATSPDYWVRHLRQPVRFGEGMRALLEDASRVLLEVGPGRTLGSLARLQIDRSAPTVVLASMRAPREPGSDLRFLLTTLGRLWLAGVPVDFRRLSAQERRRRVVLPTYPFEHKRHWLAPRAEQAVAAATPTRRADASDWFYLPSWKRSLPPAFSVSAQPRSFLVFADAQGLGDALARTLSAAGHTVHTVRPGTEFLQAEDGGFEVDPARAETYAALLDALRGQGQVPERILHLWSTDEHGPDEAGLALSQQRGFYSLLFLAQALGGASPRAPAHLLVVSTGLQAVTGHETLSPAKATVLGACRVLPRELPGLTCQSLDVEALGLAEAREALVARLAAEALGPVQEGAVALRGRHRWVQDFEPVRLEAPTADTQPRLRPRGTYLITGGLGGIGLVLAEHLARRVQARLVLVGRGELPERARWEEWLASHGELDATSRRLRQLLALEALGASVMVVTADVADAARMEDVLRQAHEAFGELHGVIHAAGVPAGGLAQLRTPEAVERVFRPKVLGTWVLGRLLRDRPLDFFMLCSSRTAYTAEPGQIDHCAACAFQDAYAHWSAAEGRGPVLSLNWDTWREVGQAVTTDSPGGSTALLDAMREHGLSSAEGVEVFERVLARELTQVVVSTEDLPAAIARGATLLQELLGTAGAEASSGAPSALPTAEAEVEAALGEIWCRLLGVERVDAHENFFELGGNSLIGLKVIAEVRRHFGVEVPVVALFENPTLGAMTRLLTRKPGDATASQADRRGRGARRREQLQQRKQSTR